jgi:hypothetical protein
MQVNGPKMRNKIESQEEKESVRIDPLVAFYDLPDSNGYILVGSPKQYGAPPTKGGD